MSVARCVAGTAAKIAAALIGALFALFALPAAAQTTCVLLSADTTTVIGVVACVNTAQQPQAPNYAALASTDSRLTAFAAAQTSAAAQAANCLSGVAPAAVLSSIITNLGGCRELRFIVTPAETMPSGTITMPSNPADGMDVIITTSQAVTSLTLTPATGQTIEGAPASLAAGGFARFTWSAATSTWYRSG